MKELLYFLRGFLVGMCDLVPGISGGTMAFVLGIYERLLNVIKNFNFDFIFFLDKPRFRRGVRNLDLRFSIPFGLGGISAILLLSYLITFLLANYRTSTYAFFFGLVLSSLVLLGRHFKKATPTRATFMILGIIIGLLFSFLTFLVLPHTPIIVFISGLLPRVQCFFRVFQAHTFS